MKIEAINNNNPSFSGRIITKGNWTQKAAGCFLNNKAVQEVANSGYTVTAKMNSKWVRPWDLVHEFGTKIYKVTVSIKKDNPTLIDKINCLFGKHKFSLNRHYHKQATIVKTMDLNLEDRDDILQRAGYKKIPPVFMAIE